MPIERLFQQPLELLADFRLDLAFEHHSRKRQVAFDRYSVFFHAQIACDVDAECAESERECVSIPTLLKVLNAIAEFRLQAFDESLQAIFGVGGRNSKLNFGTQSLLTIECW